jgi:hypothetical protein
MSNSVISIRGPTTASVVSNNGILVLGAPGTLDSYLSPPNFLTTLEGKMSYSNRALGRRSNPSEDMSTITLPSFVEHERRDSTPSPMHMPPNLPMTGGMRSLPPARRSSLPFQPSRSRSRVASTTGSTTPSSETHLRYDFPSPPLPPPHHPRPRIPSSPRQAGLRRESTTAKPKVKGGQGVNGSSLAASKLLEPLAVLPLRSPLDPPIFKVPTRTLSLGDYDSPTTGGQSPSHERRDGGGMSHSPRRIPLRPSPHETLEVPSPMNDGAGPSQSHQSPVLGLSNSYSSPDERRARTISQARSSMSIALSVSAFPSPPGYTTVPWDNTLPVVSNYPMSSRLFPPVTLWENASARRVETASPSEGRASPALGAGVLWPISTISSRSTFNRHLHPELTDRDNMPIMSGAYSRASSMRRLSRMPSGPRQMSGKQTAPLRSLRRWTPQPLSI